MKTKLGLKTLKRYSMKASWVTIQDKFDYKQSV